MNDAPQRTQRTQRSSEKSLRSLRSLRFMNTWKSEIGKWNPYASLSSAVV